MGAAQVQLRNEFLDALVLPGVGGGLARLDWIAAPEPIAFMRPVAADRIDPDPNELACYPMIPWCNRIGAGRFEFNGKHYHLPPNRANEAYPIHGDGWLAAWSIGEQSPTSLTLHFDHIGSGPFIYRGTLNYQLHSATLSITLSAENRGPETMPFGLGLHPWFLRTPDAEVEASAAGLWEAGEDLLPVTRRRLAGRGALYPLQAAPGKTIDNVFFGWDGVAFLRWPERKMGLRLVTEPALSHFTLYAPLEKPFFCLEPVTHPVNALNLPAPHLREGLVCLRNGESTSITTRFEAVRLD
jgi:aldose 1-epimerase